jgi:hypothetical protein
MKHFFSSRFCMVQSDPSTVYSSISTYCLPLSSCDRYHYNKNRLCFPLNLIPLLSCLFSNFNNVYFSTCKNFSLRLRRSGEVWEKNVEVMSCSLRKWYATWLFAAKLHDIKSNHLWSNIVTWNVFVLHHLKSLFLFIPLFSSAEINSFPLITYNKADEVKLFQTNCSTYH